MSKDKNDIARQDDLADAKKTEKGAVAAKHTESDEEELEEGLEESMAGSDAPASTRRSETS